MLLDLENIEKVFVTKDGKTARTIKALAGTALKKARIVPRKHGKGGGSGGPAPKKARSAKKKGGGDSGQMAYLTEKFEKLKKKLKKSKKVAKKHARDLSDSDSNSD
jgi:hypothetical protein